MAGHQPLVQPIREHHVARCGNTAWAVPDYPADRIGRDGRTSTGPVTRASGATPSKCCQPRWPRIRSPGAIRARSARRRLADPPAHLSDSYSTTSAVSRTAPDGRSSSSSWSSRRRNACRPARERRRPLGLGRGTGRCDTDIEADVLVVLTMNDESITEAAETR